ncbi:MAG: hypothetical protein U0W24_25185 [Bacteroidales bacterium]
MTRAKVYSDGFYIEVYNKGEDSGIKLRRNTKEEMLEAIEQYKKSKIVVVWGESKNGKWLNESFRAN